MNRMQVVIISVIAALAVGAGIAVPYGIGTDFTNTPDGGDNIPPGTNQTDPQVDDDGFDVLPDSNLPSLNQANMRVEKVAAGLAMPTSMVFLGNDDVLILQKDNGRVRQILDGKLLPDPIHDVFVKNESERGLLGIAVAQGSNSTEDKIVFLYYTVDDSEDIRNRVYRYNYTNGGLVGETMILDLPGTPGPNHDGGKLAIGPDGMLYAVIGDLNRNGMLQNYAGGQRPDDTSVILRVDFSGEASDDSVLSDNEVQTNEALSKYFAYGIRNSFGIDFDPLTGRLWDTENGPRGYDEINIVDPGFNSGWEKVMGPIERTNIDESTLLSFSGSHYRDPAFSWRQAQGITDIEFFNSTNLGTEYANNIFVGDINNGNLYYFDVNQSRDGLSFESSNLADLVADDDGEMGPLVFGTGFRGITDIETGPDGHLYVLSFGGNLYRIVPDT